MSIRNIIAVVLAVVVGYFAIKLVFGILGVVMSILGMLFWIAIAGGVVYMLYRAFNNMLTSGKRLT